MKVLHVVSTFSPEHGGPTQEIGNHCELLSKHGTTIELYTLSGFAGTSPPRQVSGLSEQMAFAINGPNALGFSWNLIWKLRAMDRPDLFHIHGVWHLAQISACLEAQRRRIPYIYHLMGGFTEYELGRKSLRKQIARVFYQDWAIRNAACIHVNGLGEAEFLRREGFRQPVAILPVGAAMPKFEGLTQTRRSLSQSEKDGVRFILYLARLHPTKGVEILLGAWRELAEFWGNWKLVIAGPGDPAYMREIQAKIAEGGYRGSILLEGLLSEGEKAAWYTRASAYVLPSLQENFGNTVVEALGYGLPVLTTTRTPWTILEESEAGFLCEPTIESLARSLRDLLSLAPDVLEGIGQKGRNLAERDYSLSAVVEDLEEIYQWLSGGAFPSFIRI